MSIAHTARRIMRRFLKSERGAVIVYVALATVPMFIAIGAAVDTTRAYHARDRLSHALDAAGLAVGAALSSGEDPQTVLNNYFRLNYPDQSAMLQGNPTLVITNNVITVSANISMPASFMRVAGFDQIPISSTSQIKRDDKAMEIALVLDNTGSMYGSKIAALRSAATDLVNILFGTTIIHDRLSVGVIPYAATVNIGSIAPQVVGNDPAGFFNTADPSQWKGCVMARGGGEDLTDNYTSGVNDWSFYWYPSGQDNPWPPIYNFPSFPWWNTGPNVYCPTPITPLNNNKNTVLAAIDAMQIWGGGTFVNLGMAWGWRVLSPSTPFTEGKAYSDPDNIKVAILMTDGLNQFGGSPRYSRQHLSGYTSYGYLEQALLGTTSYSGATTELNNRLTQVCNNMKAAGILVYTITFQLTDPTTKAIFQACATDPAKYFNSPSQGDLQSAFQTIGNELRNLHISQ